jgi:hypothetical protein
MYVKVIKEEIIHIYLILIRLDRVGRATLMQILHASIVIHSTQRVSPLGEILLYYF